MSCGGEGLEIPSGLRCPNCPGPVAGWLWILAYYLRSFKDFTGTDIRIKITRLRCSKCRVTHACLFPCLVPHSSYSAEALGQLATSYFFEEKSYEKLGWETSEDEGEGHRHLVYELVARVCRKQDWVAGFVEREAQSAGESVWRRKEPEPLKECVNAYKARSKAKRAALGNVRALLLKFREGCKQEMEALIGILHQVSMQLKAPFSLLSLAKVQVVRTAHLRGDALF
ncbi:MAG: DUF6431 domain-containing protein [Ktedonobacteraceae bacterium]